ncbi:MAG: tol-pal system protein YbgF [Vicinamibacteraceae bacterium]
MRRSAIVLTVTSLLVLGATRVGAADREHQQIMAEIRMLQEQSQQLQRALVTLSDTLEALNTKIDTQGETARRSFADQKLLVDNLGNDVSVVREKLDDTGVRLNSLSQEMDALRQSVVSAANAPRPESVAQVPVTREGETASPSGTSPTTTAPGTTSPDTTGPETTNPETTNPETTNPETAPETTNPETTGPETAGASGTTLLPVLPADASEAEPTGEAASAAAAPAVPPGASPSRMFDSAFADYASGQWPLAISGFDSFLRTFPQSDLADNAQFLIGEAYSMDQKLTDAVSSYDKVIATYPDGDKVPDSLYKKGLALSLLDEEDRAREAFETVIKEHPDSEAATLAKQVLDGMNRRSR